MKREIKEVALKSRYFISDHETCALTLRAQVPPELPPEGHSEMVARMPPDLMRVEPHWALVGSSQQIGEHRNAVTTCAEPWNYSACARPELNDLAFDRYWYWLRVRVSQVKGSPLLSLYDPIRNVIAKEIAIAPSDDASDYYFELRDNVHRVLLLRNGPLRGQSAVEFAGFDLIRMPIAPA
jgi:hypothetical protein